jgi:HK97 family phage prohead protease
MEKSLGVQLELKDLDTSKRTAVIKHAVYTSVDKVRDISTKGMFTKSWKELTPDFLFNHATGATVGSTKRTFEDEQGGYTEVKFGNWTLGNDTLEMAIEGVLKGASYGYETLKKDFIEIKGQKVRRLKEVKHIETSLLTVLPAHPEAGIMTLNKSFDQLELKSLSESEQTLLKTLLLNDQSSIEQLVMLMGAIKPESDLYTWVGYQISSRADRMSSIMSQLKWNVDQMNGMKSHVKAIEKFCKNANASDESILSLSASIEEYKQIISEYDTATTPLATEQGASDEEIATKLSRIKLLLAS